MSTAFPIDFTSSVNLVPRPGLRVVIFEPDPSVESRLEAIVALDSVFVPVGSARSAAECERLMSEYVPELVICREGEAATFLQPDTPALVLLVEPLPNFGLREKDTGNRLSLEQPGLADTIARIKARVFERKTSEILLLMEAMKSDSHDLSLHSEEVWWVDADRNYLVLHTPDGVVRRRGTLSSFLSASAHSFIRVSRSRAVLRTHVEHVSVTGHQVILALKCGTKLGVSRSCQRHLRRMYNLD